MDFHGNTVPDNFVLNITPRKTFVFVGNAKKISKITFVAKAASGESKVYVERNVTFAEADYITWDESQTALTILEEAVTDALSDGYATAIATALNNAIVGS